MGEPVRRRRIFGVLPLVQVVGGIVVAWMFFHFVGRVLVAIPASFHEGTVWSKEEE